MTRDEYLIHIYGQRGKVLGWLRRQGVPTAEAEIMVDKGIDRCLKRWDRGHKKQTLGWETRGLLKDYIESRMGRVVPRGDLERLENALEQQRRGRVPAAPHAD